MVLLRIPTAVQPMTGIEGLQTNSKKTQRTQEQLQPAVSQAINNPLQPSVLLY